MQDRGRVLGGEQALLPHLVGHLRAAAWRVPVHAGGVRRANPRRGGTRRSRAPRRGRPGRAGAASGPGGRGTAWPRARAPRSSRCGRAARRGRAGASARRRSVEPALGGRGPGVVVRRQHAATDADLASARADTGGDHPPPRRGRRPAASRPGCRGKPPRTGIEVVEPDPAWPWTVRAAARTDPAALGDAALVVEHVGSTAVPGLPAKPVIDIDLTVADSADEAAWLPALEAAGFELVIREPWWHEHRCLTLRGPALQPARVLPGLPRADPARDLPRLAARAPRRPGRLPRRQARRRRRPPTRPGST